MGRATNIRHCALVVATLLLAHFVAAQTPANPPQPQPQRVSLFEGAGFSVPATWRVSAKLRNAVQIFVPPAKTRKQPPRDRKSGKPQETPIVSEAGMTVFIEPRRDHADALARLANIASEQPVKSSFLIVSGLPGIERRYRAPMPQPGDGDAANRHLTWFETTAVASGATVIRFETMLAPDADPKLLDEAAAIARTLAGVSGNDDTAKRDLDEIERLTRIPRVMTQPSPSPRSTTEHRHHGDKGSQPGSTFVQTNNGELEVAASDDGQHVVVAANGGWSFSDNSGVTFTTGGTAPPCIYSSCDGDPSLAVGFSGTFYQSWLGFPTSEPSGHADGSTVSVSTSPDGHAWTFGGDAVFCAAGDSTCSLDQEHIAADRLNRSQSSNDLLYVVYRNLVSTTSSDIVCSTDGGVTWSTTPTVIDTGDFPRVSVGPDGSVYVAYEAGENMNLRKFSSCDDNLVPDPVFTVAAFTPIPCPMSGLDRCNDGNTLSSPTAAADDTDPNHVYYAFATSTSASNDDVMVYDSTDGGASFPRSIQVNSAVAARRFMPWLSTVNGFALLTWYDRRNATTPATNDLTGFWGGRVWVKAGNLMSAEYDVARVDDPQCAFWPCGARDTACGTMCPTPFSPGQCIDAAGKGFALCDLLHPSCNAGETCQLLGGGCPKYGDYNGNAAIAGRVFYGWASSTPPPDVTGATPGINVYASSDPVPSDYYVRDWTDSEKSFDPGSEPSDHASFWTTSDVWNQSTSTPDTPSGGWILGDPPVRGGTNFAFARVSRRHPASPSAPAESVSVHFLSADYGLGMAFADAGTQSVTFNGGDRTTITPANAWSVDPSASIHLCLAVEITGPGGTDDFIPPSLAGNSPGPADPLILSDNNKAQRNLQETLDAGAGFEMMAEIRLAGLRPKDFKLRVKVPPEAGVEGSIEVIGGERRELRSGDLDLGVLQPGEVRWVRLRVTKLSESPAGVLIECSEAGGGPGNGFTILARRAGAGRVAARNMSEYASVIGRLAAITGSAEAKEEAEAARHLGSDGKEVDPKLYLAFLTEHARATKTIARTYLARRKSKPFHVAVALKRLSLAVAAGNAAEAATAHKAFIERLDAQMTMDQRAKGVVSDILHNVLWQKALFESIPDLPAAGEIVHKSREFIDAFELQKATATDFPTFLRSIDKALRAAAQSLTSGNAKAGLAFAALRKGEEREASAARLQRLHRNFLLEVQKAAR